jgi:hypothetical protein
LTQQVGEEDRLIFSAGEQPVSDETLRRLEQEVDGVTRADCKIIHLQALQESGETEDVMADIRSTGTMTVLRSGQTKESVITVYAKRGRKALPAIIHILDEASIDIRSVEVREPDLEAVFLKLTGRALRD